jgi:aspartate/methionine/tyrosine aminotransferase
LLNGRAKVRDQITARTRSNLAVLDTLLGDSAMVSRLTVEAGWYAVLRVPAVGTDDALTVTVAETWGVLVYPGHYYGFQGEGWLVVSLLPPPAEFKQGIERVLSCCAERCKLPGA